MFDHRHYVPILKGKKGELEALAKADNLQQFTPVVEVVPIPLTHPEDGSLAYQSKTIDQHVKDTANAYKRAMGILPSVFIDGFYIEGEDKLRDGQSAMRGLFSRLREARIRFVPTIGLDRLEDYIDAVREAVKIDGRGCCLRLWESDLESLSGFDRQIQTLLGALNVSPDKVNLLVDFKEKVPPKVTLPLLINELPWLNDWGTLTFSSSSFPQFLGDIKANGIEERERSEWMAWVFVREKQNAEKKRVPTFGDYGINHPTLTDDTDPRMITVAPNIRYSDKLRYVIAKGQAQPRKKQAKTPEQKAARLLLAPNVQYPKLASKIKNHPAWKADRNLSWGDKKVDDCSQHRFVGTLSEWRGIGASHHIALTVQQLANLP
ncbi:MAG: hypothetical protein WBX38_09130 [Candidatus Sulfotelmatobacter sp.]